MRIWISFISIVVIHLTHVFTAPLSLPENVKSGALKTKFGKIADVIINPQWTLKDPDSKNKDPNNDTNNTDPNNTGDVNDPEITNNDKNDSHNIKKRRPKKNNNNNRNRKKSDTNRKRNNQKQNNTRRNGRYRWYKLVTVDYLLGNLPEYRNHEDQQKIVLIWGDGDKENIELDEHIDELPMKNLNTNQLIRKKRNYIDTFQLQDKLNTEATTNDNIKYVEPQNNKLENIQNKQNVKQKKTYKNPKKSKEHYRFKVESSLVDNLEEDENSMESNIIDNTNENSKNLNFKNTIKNNFQHIVKNRKHPTNTIRSNEPYKHELMKQNHSQHLGKNSGNSDSEIERSHQKTIGKIPKNITDTPTKSNDVQEFTMEGKPDTHIHELDKIDTFIDKIKSNSVENKDDQNYEPYSSSLASKQEKSNFRGIEDNKEHGIWYDIRHPMTSKLKNIGKNQSDGIDLLQNSYGKKVVKPLKVSNIRQKRSHQATVQTHSPNSKDILIVSYDEPELTTKVNAEMVTQLPTIDEIDTLMDKITSKSDENLDDQSTETPLSSLESKEDNLNYSDIEHKKERNLFKNIEHPLKFTTKKLRKKLSNNNDELPRPNNQNTATQMVENNNEEKEPQQKSIAPIPLSSKKVPSKSIAGPKLTKIETTEIPAVDEIDLLMDKMTSNSDENIDDQSFESPLSSLESKEDNLKYSDIEHKKKSDVYDNIEHQLEPTAIKLRKKLSNKNDELPKPNNRNTATQMVENNIEEKEPQQKSIAPIPLSSKKVPSKSIAGPKLTKIETTEIPAVDEIDLLMDKMTSNSDEKIYDQSFESPLSSLESKEDNLKYSDIEHKKKSDVYDNIEHQLEPTEIKLRKKLSNKNDELPKPNNGNTASQMVENNNEEKEPQQKSIAPIPLSSKKVPSKSIAGPKLTKIETTEIPAVDEIDLLMDKMTSNSDENIDDQSFESPLSSLESKEDNLKYSDIEHKKKSDVYDNIEHQLEPTAIKLRKKLSNKNDELPKPNNRNTATQMVENNNEEKEPQQKSIAPIPLSSKKVPSKSIAGPKLTKIETTEIPAVDEIDLLMDKMTSNSDEKIDDQSFESPLSSLESKEDNLKYSDIEHKKKSDVYDNIEHQLEPTAIKLRKKLSNKNDELPKPNNRNTATQMVENNIEEKEPQQKSIAPIPLSSKKVPSKSIAGPKLTKIETTEIPAVDEIDLLMDKMTSNSDEKIDDQSFESPLSSLESKEDNLKYSDIEHKKKSDVYDNIEHQLEPTAIKLRKKLSNKNDELPKPNNRNTATQMVENNNEEKEPQQKSIAPIPLSSKKVPSKSIAGPKLTKIETTEIPAVDEIDLLMDKMTSNSDEKIDDQSFESPLSSLESKEDNLKYSDIEHKKKSDVYDNIEHQLEPTAIKLRKKISNKNDELPKPNNGNTATQMIENNNEEKEPQQKSIAPIPLSSKKVPSKSIAGPKLTKKETTEIPAVDEIDLLMDKMTSNSDEKIYDQSFESPLSSLESKEDNLKYSDIEHKKKSDVYDNIEHQLEPTAIKLRKKLSNTNDELPKPNNRNTATQMVENNNEEKEPQQKSIAPIPLSSKKVPSKSIAGPKLTKIETTEIPAVDEIDLLMDKMTSNSDEKIYDQSFESPLSSLESKEDNLKYSDIEHKKKSDVYDNIEHQLEPTEIKLRKKLSNKNDELPKPNNGNTASQMVENNNEEKEPQQKSIAPIPLSSKKVPSKSIAGPKLTKIETTEIPAVDEIDLLMDKMTSNSDEKIYDQSFESPLSSLESKEDNLKYSDIEHKKKSDVYDNIEHQLEPTEIKLRKKLSNKNDELPKPNNGNTATQMVENNNEEKEPQQKSIAPIPLSSKKVPSKSIAGPKLTKIETTEIPAVDEIDLLMDKMTSNSDEKIDDQSFESPLSSLESKEDNLKYSDIEHKKKSDVYDNIEHQLEPTEIKLRKKLSNKNDELPKPNNGNTATQMVENNNEEKEPQQKSIAPIPPSSIKIPMQDYDPENISNEEYHHAKSSTTPTKDANSKYKIKLPHNAAVDQNINANDDKIIHGKNKINHLISKIEKPIAQDYVSNNKKNELPILTIPKDEESKSLNEKQATIHPDYKLVSSPIDELIDSRIDVDGSQSSPIDFDDINSIIKENNEDNLQKTKEDNARPKIPNVLEKNKSLEKPNTNIQLPHIPDVTIANNTDEPINNWGLPSIGNPAKEFVGLDTSDEYKGLGGVAMVDSDVRKTDDKKTTIPTQQQHDLMEKNKSIPNNVINTKTSVIPDNIDASTFFEEKPEDQLAYINGLLNDNAMGLKPKNESIDLETTPDKLQKSETVLPTYIPLDRNENIGHDNILQKVTRPKTVLAVPIGDDDSGSNVDLFTPSVHKGEGDSTNSLNEKQATIHPDYKVVSSPIDELIDSHIDVGGSQSSPIDFDDINSMIKENNEENLQKTKEDKARPKIPKILEKNKSLEEPNTNIQLPHIPDVTIANNTDEPINNWGLSSIGNPAKEFVVLETSDEYKGLGGMTMEESDVRKTDDKKTTIPTQQQHDLMEKNKSIPNNVINTKTSVIPDNIDASTFFEEKPEDQLAYINGLLNDNAMGLKPKIESIDLETTPDKLQKSETVLPTYIPLDRNENIGHDNILQKVTRPKTVLAVPIGDDDSGSNVDLFTPSVHKGEGESTNILNENQATIHPDYKVVSSPIDELIDSHIDVGGSQSSPIDFDDINSMIKENNEENLQKTKEDKARPKIPNILEKNKSLEEPNTNIQLPHIPDVTIANNTDEPINNWGLSSIGNPAKKFVVLETSDEYKGLGGMTMEESDVRKTDDKKTTIPTQQQHELMEKNKSIPNNVINTKTSVIPDNIDASTFFEEKPEDQLAYINSLLNDNAMGLKPKIESIDLETTPDQLQKSETILSTFIPLDRNENIGHDNILQKVTRPKTVLAVPIGDDDSGSNVDLFTPSVHKGEGESTNILNENQATIHPDYKVVSSPIDELIDSHIDVGGSQSSPIDFDDINSMIKENNEENLQKTKEDKARPKIPNILEKNKSLEEPNTNIQLPHIPDVTIANNTDEPINNWGLSSIGNPAKEFVVLETSDEYNGLGGMTMEESDVRKTDDKKTTIPTQQQHELMEKNKSIPNNVINTKTSVIPDNIDASTFFEEKPEDQLAYINSLLNDNAMGLKPKIESIDLETTPDQLQKSETILSTFIPLDRNENIGHDNILQKVTRPKTVLAVPIGDDDSGSNVDLFTPSVHKGEGESTNILNENQATIHPDYKVVSSPIDELIDSHIDVGGSQSSPIDFDDINSMIKENNEENLQKTKEDKARPKIPNILEKNKSLEEPNTNIQLPHIPDVTIANNTDEPINNWGLSSIGNPAKEFVVLETSDEYNGLGGMTMEESDVRKTDDKKTTIPTQQQHELMEKNKSIPNNVINTKTSVIPDNIDASTFFEEKPEDQLAYINSLLNDNAMGLKPKIESIDLETTPDQLQKSETILPTFIPLDRNENIGHDNILQKVTRPKTVLAVPIGDDDSGSNVDLFTPSVHKGEGESTNILNENQATIHPDYKVVSSPIDELIDSHIDVGGSQSSPIDFDDINSMIKENNEENLQKTKEDKARPKIPNILEKNKSLEEPNTNIQLPHIPDVTIANNTDEPINNWGLSSIGNPAKEFVVLETSDEYNGLGGMTMEESDVRKTDDKKTTIPTQQQHELMEKNKSIPNNVINTKTSVIPDNIDASTFFEEKPEDQLAYINSLLNDNAMGLKPKIESIDLETTPDQLQKSETILPTFIPLDRNENIGHDNILQKVTRPKTVLAVPIGDDDSGSNVDLFTPSVHKGEGESTNILNENQATIHPDYKVVSSPIDELIDSHIDVGGSQSSPIDFDDINSMIKENNEENLQKTKEDKARPKIPNILEKNKSLEKPNTNIQLPHIPDVTIVNNTDEPINNWGLSSIGNPAKKFVVLETSDEYKGLGGMTMEESDVRKTDDKKTTIPTQQQHELMEKNKSIPNNVINTKTSVIPDNIDASTFFEEKPEDQLAYINSLLNDNAMGLKPKIESIDLETTPDQLQKSETILSTFIPLDRNENIGHDNILQKVTRPKTVLAVPIGDDDSGSNVDLFTPSVHKGEGESTNILNENQATIHPDYKVVSSPIDELIDSHIDVGGSQSSPIDFDDINSMIKENNEENLQKTKEDKARPKIPNILEKNKSLEKPNTNIQLPHIPDVTIANNTDEPINNWGLSSIGNPAKKFVVLETSDEYKGLGGMTMEESDVRKTDDKKTTIPTQQQHELMEKNKSIPNNVINTKTSVIPDNIDASTFFEEKPEDQLAYINSLLNDNAMGLKPKIESIDLETTPDQLQKSETILPTFIPLDRNENIGHDNIIQKVTRPKTVLAVPIGDDDSGSNVDLFTPSVHKGEGKSTNILNENQAKIHPDYKVVSSPIDELIDSHIDVGGSQSSPIDFDDINSMIKENNEENLQKTKEDKARPKIPNILKKNKSLEEPNTNIQLPHIPDVTIANNTDEPINNWGLSSIGNPAKKFVVLETSDEYKGLGGMTMEESDVSKTDDKKTTIPTQQQHELMEKNKSIPNNVINTKTSVIPDNIDASTFFEEKPEDQLAYINSLLNDNAMGLKPKIESIDLETTPDQLQKSETILPTFIPLDRNENIGHDNILQKVTRPKTVLAVPIGDDDSGSNVDLFTPSVHKGEGESTNILNENQATIHPDYKVVSSPIDELIDSHIDVGGSQSSPIDFDDINSMIKENNEENLQKTKEDKARPKIPNILEKNKSLEEPNTNIQLPHIPDVTIANNTDEPINNWGLSSIGNPAKEFVVLETSDEYNGLGGMTMEESDVRKTDDKKTTIPTQQQHELMEKNKSIPNNVINTKTSVIPDNIDASTFFEEKPEDQLAYINSLLNDNAMGLKPKIESIDLETTPDQLQKSETILPTFIPLDRNENIGHDNILQKVTRPKTVLAVPIGDDDSGSNVDLFTPSVHKGEGESTNSLNEKQATIHPDYKVVSSPIDELLDSHIDVGGSQSSPIDFDDINSMIKENNEENLQKTKEDKARPKIPNIIKKNKSLVKPNTNIQSPHIPDVTIANNTDEPINNWGLSSKGNPAKEFVGLDTSDEYKGLGGLTMVDSDVRKTDDIKTTIPTQKQNEVMEKNKSILNIVNNTRTPEIADIIEMSKFFDGDSCKNINLVIPSMPKSEKEILKNIVAGNSANAVSKSKSCHNGYNPNSLNSNVSIPDRQSSVPNVIDKQNHNLFYEDGKSDGNGGGETKLIKDYDLNSKKLSENVENNDEPTNYENLKEFEKTKMNNHTLLLDDDFSKVKIHDGSDNICYDSNHMDKLPKIKSVKNDINHFIPSIIVSSKDNSPIISDYNFMNEDNNPYGCMLRKFTTKYVEGGDSNNNLWETVPPKKSNIFTIHKEFDNFNNDGNQSKGYTVNNRISSHAINDKKIAIDTEAVKSSYDGKGNADTNNNLYDDFLKSMSEKLFKKIDNIDDKISKFDKSSKNGSYIRQSYDIRSDDPSTKQIILMNGLPNSKPKNEIDIEEPDSITNKSVDSFETIKSDESNDENEIKKSTKIQKDEDKKHKKPNKKHRKHSKHDKHKKKKSRKKNEIIDSGNDDGSHKKYKSQKKKDIKNVDESFKENKSKNKYEIIDYDSYGDNDNDDDDDDDDDDVKVSRSKKIDNKKKKKKKENISSHECNEVDSSTSLQINSEDNNSVKGLKMKSKLKNSKKTNSTKNKKSLPKKKSKHKKQSKSIYYKNKKISVDVSDKDSSSNEDNYKLEKSYVKINSNNNQNNAPQEKKHKHKKSKHKYHKKPLKIKKIYKYKELPVDKEDKSSDEYNVNLEKAYNINITDNDKALKQKRLRHKRLRTMKNFDINIVKDTDNQVLNKDTNTMHGYQFYTFYRQNPYTNPFGRLFSNSLYAR